MSAPLAAAVVIEAPAPAPVTEPQPADTHAAVNEPPFGSAATMAPPPPKTLEPELPSDSARLTDVRFENTGGEQLDVPVTFGQVFVAGQFAPEKSLAGRFADGTSIPLQVDVKARHGDGSVRHAVISGTLPHLAKGGTSAIGLVTGAATAGSPAAGPAALLERGFSAAATIEFDGKRYSTSADSLLRSGTYTTWLSGPVVNEWHVSAPLTTADGTAHPHLTARFAIRSYSNTSRARVDFTIENNWAYEAAPQDFTYNASLTLGDKEVYAKAGMKHFNHARWRKTFWWGETPAVHIKHNTAYLIASKAVPNYDQSLVFAEATLAAIKTDWIGAKTEPMGVGLANPYMPSTGGRPDIGLLPSWAATYLLTMDKRAKEVTLGTADLAGSWSSHYRNKITDRPVSLVEYPYMTIVGRQGDTYNTATRKSEWFPACAANASCANVNLHDASHQPNFAYLPYLVTGDYYYLEELQFWAMWNSFMSNPGYREYGKALLKSEQVRGQAWALRSLAEAAYITPDTDRLKSHFTSFINSNLDWYNAEYANNAKANTLGILINGYAVVYANNTGIAPWQDDFFTAAVGHAAELGFEKAKPILGYKAQFPIARMTAPGACWIDGAIYAMTVRTTATAPIFATMNEAYAASHTAAFGQLECAGKAMADSLRLKIGEMTGYASSVAGYPANMQPALAYAVDSGNSTGRAAWTVFNARTIKPNYSLSPQFSIIPR